MLLLRDVRRESSFWMSESVRWSNRGWKGCVPRRKGGIPWEISSENGSVTESGFGSPSVSEFMELQVNAKIAVVAPLNTIGAHREKCLPS